MTSRWAELAEKARKAGGEVWTAERQDEDDGSIYWAIHSTFDYEFITNAHAPKNANFIAAANPKAILELTTAYNAILEELRTARDAALMQAATIIGGWSMETWPNSADKVAKRDIAMADAILALRSHPAEPTGWRDIGTAPLDGTYVDLWVNGPDGYRKPDCYFREYWRERNHEMVRAAITAWRDLPTPPRKD